MRWRGRTRSCRARRACRRAPAGAGACCERRRAGSWPRAAPRCWRSQRRARHDHVLARRYLRDGPLVVDGRPLDPGRGRRAARGSGLSARYRGSARFLGWSGTVSRRFLGIQGHCKADAAGKEEDQPCRPAMPRGPAGAASGVRVCGELHAPGNEQGACHGGRPCPRGLATDTERG